MSNPSSCLRVLITVSNSPSNLHHCSLTPICVVRAELPELRTDKIPVSAIVVRLFGWLKTLKIYVESRIDLLRKGDELER